MAMNPPDRTASPWDQYPFLIEDTARLSDRRQTVNTLYLSANSLLLGALAILIQQSKFQSVAIVLVVAVIAWAGVVICADWRRLIANYRELLKLRFRLLNELESRPDFFYLVKTFQRENEELYNPESKKRNPSLGLFGFSAVEEKIPGVFQFLYICGFLIAAALTVLVVSGVAGQFMRLLNIPSLL